MPNASSPKITKSRVVLPLTKICTHPDNPNVMSEKDYKKVRGLIERTGAYPTIIARTLDASIEFGEERAQGLVQVLDGKHRLDMARDLGFDEVDVDLWHGVDDHWARLYLADLNHLAGKDDVRKRSKLLQRLKEGMGLDNDEMAEHFIPETAKELAKLEQLAAEATLDLTQAHLDGPKLLSIFVTEAQEQIIKAAIERRQQMGIQGADATAIEGAALSSICTKWLED